MSPKERAHKFRHGDQRRRRRTCLPSCFSSPRAYEADDGGDDDPWSLTSASSSSSSSMVAEKTMSNKSSSSWFSWSRLRKRRKKKKKKTISEVHHLPIDSLSHELHKARNHPQQNQQQPRQNLQETSTPSTTLPHISVKYNARSHPVRLNPTLTEMQTNSKNTGSPKPNRESSELARTTHHQQEKLQPVVGLFILVATLAMMLLFGRTCAVLCLCACFYLVPILRIGGEGNSVNGGGEEKSSSLVEVVDLESEEYKKRVVLEGLLERDGKRLAKMKLGKDLPTK